MSVIIGVDTDEGVGVLTDTYRILRGLDRVNVERMFPI